MPRSSRTAPVDGLERMSSQPILTEDQRATLDAALAKRQAESAAATAAAGFTPTDPSILVERGASAKGSYVPPPKTKRQVAHDHHMSRRAKGNGKAKKGGAGGKYTWGSLLAEDFAASGDAAADRGDPNYDSDEEAAVAGVWAEEAGGVFWADAARAEVAGFKAGVVSALEEYYSTGDLAEAAACVAELRAPQYGFWVVKRALTCAMGRHGREREMTSVLLASLHGEVLSERDVARGFAELAAGLNDLTLDVPDAEDLLALFAARAVADDALAPAALQEMAAAAPTPEVGQRLFRACELHGGAKHAAERLARCWGGAAGFDLAESRAAVASMLEEYSAGGDVAEVRRLLGQLAVPFFHHELVKQGFARVAAQLDDLELDVPSARATFERLVEAGKKAGWLEEGFGSEESLEGSPSSVLQSNGSATFKLSVAGYKASVKAIILEYFEAGDVGEVVRSLPELAEPGFHHLFVKYVVQLALDRKDRERELASALLPALVPDTISHEQASLGFQCLLAVVEDLTLDVPDAEPLLALFLGRAVVDEVLPPAFLAEAVPRLRGTVGARVLHDAGCLLSARHAAERLAGCWHGRLSSPHDLAAAMRDAVNEYVTSGDVGEAERCLLDLAVPHFHHEMVLRSVLAACAGQQNVPAIVRLLAALSSAGVVTDTQMSTGFERVKANLDDIVLDFPMAREIVAGLEETGNAEGWLPKTE